MIFPIVVSGGGGGGRGREVERGYNNTEVQSKSAVIPTLRNCNYDV